MKTYSLTVDRSPREYVLVQRNAEYVLQIQPAHEIVLHGITDVGLRGLPGAPGNQGERGPAGYGVGRRWYGEGPPDVVIGAAVNDEYLDVLTGDLYTLQ